MSQIAFWGAVELGLVFAFVAIGVYLAFRVLDFPDLTVDGSFPLGAAVTGVLILGGMNPWLAAIIAMIAGAAAGLVTATLNVRFKILNLLASILTMIALFSVNLRVMGAPNISLISQDTMLTPFFGHGIPEYYVRPLFLFVLVAIAVFIVWRFLESDMGLAMRATGANPKMARAQGVRTDRQIYLGMALSNALVALGGALFAQTNGFADVTSGAGTIVVGLAAVIIGGTALEGGRGTVVGTLVGLLLLGIISNGLVLEDVSSFWQPVVIGALLLIAIILDEVRRRAALKVGR